MSVSKISLNDVLSGACQGQQEQRVIVIALSIAFAATMGCKDPTLPKAAEAGDRLAIERLIENGSDINALDADSWTALQQALLKGNEDIVRLLLAHGADPNFTDSTAGHANPLGIAIVIGRSDLVELLLENGARIDGGKIGYSALDMAALRGQKEIVELLLNRVAEPDFDRLLFPAVVSGQTNMVALILAKGVNIDSKMSHSGETVLLQAVRSGDMEMVRFLVKNGANVDASDANGNTPRRLASQMGEKEIEKYFTTQR